MDHKMVASGESVPKKGELSDSEIDQLAPPGPQDPGDTLCYEAITALGELREEVDEVDALILAAAHAVQRAPDAAEDDAAGRRALRHTVYLIECAQQRSEALQEKTNRVASDILARWSVRKDHKH